MEILTLLCCITLSSSRENQRSAQEVARRISGAVAGDSMHKSRHTKYPSQTLIPRITLFAICLSFSSPTLHPCRFIRPLFRLLLVSSFVVMASSFSLPPSTTFEVLHFKQREGENLKDAWYRMIESYRGCTIEGDFKVLLRNFYVGLTVSHRQLLDFAAKGILLKLILVLLMKL